MKNLHGSWAALATPFKNDVLDEEAYRRLLRHQIASGTSGLVPVGTTGEGSALTADEHSQVIAWATEEAGGKVPVVAGAGTNSLKETLKAIARARDAGADGALVVTPYYNKPTQQGLFEYYQAVGRAHPAFPLIVYNVPSRTGVDLNPETCLRLCEVPEVVAVKEATGNMVRTLEILERCGDRLALFSGDDFTVLPFIACGGKGVISVSANVAPQSMAQLVAAARAGDAAKALQLQLQLSPLHRGLFVESNPIPVKWALHRLGFFGPDLRLPLTPLSEMHRIALENELKHLDLL